MMRRFYLFLALQFSATLLYAANEQQNKKTITEVTDPIGFADFAQVFIGLAVVIAVILGVAWAIKRMGYVNSHASGALKIIGGISLTQRERLLLVQVGNKQLLLGVAPGRITTLHELAENIETNAPAKDGEESFAARLNAYLRGNKT